MSNKKQTTNKILGYLKGTDLQPRETIWRRPDGTTFIAAYGEDHTYAQIVDNDE